MNRAKKADSATKKVRTGSTGWMLKILSASLDAEMSNELKRLDLSLGQFAVLMTLSETEGLTQSEIGKKITMPGYATTRTIDALEEKRYVERRKDDRSRRSYRIYLTERSRKIVPQLFTIVGSVNGRLLSVLSSKEQKELIAILKKLVASRIG